jgi:hypothetical protein
MVEGVSGRRRRWARRSLAGLVVVCTVATTLAWGVGPYSKNYRHGFWPLTPNDRQHVLDHAVAEPGSHDTVSATYNLVPHLTHREHIYTFPNPWRPANWGVHNENTHDPGTIDWLVIDRRVLGADDRELLDSILQSGDWVTKLDKKDIVVAHRVRPRSAN